MADNVSVYPGDAGTPYTVATDDDGTAQHQYVKLEFGPDNTQTKVTATVGLPVSDAGGSLTVDGTVAATQSGTWTVQPGNTANTTAWKVDASSAAVPITDNSGSLTVDQPTGTNLHTVVDSGTITTVSTVSTVTNVVHVDDNSGSLTVDAPVGTPVFARLSDGSAALGSGSGTAAAALRVELPTNGTGVLATVGTITNVVHVDDNSGSLTVDYATTGSGTATGALRVELPTNGTGVVGLNAGTNAIGKLTANSGVIIGDVNNVGQASSATVTQVASSATNVTLKASNAARKGLTIFNDSTQAVFVKFGATASSTSFTVKIAAAGYYELPYTVHGCYYGIVDGIWVSANGNAYVTEW